MPGWRCLLAGLVLGLSLTAAAQDSLSSKLLPLQPLLGKTWRGRFMGPDSSKQMFDVARWERVLNGQAVRVLHSVNDGVYGGETVITWSTDKQSLVFTYFTTAGFSTAGTIRIEGGRIIAHEAVSGDANGITDVRSATEFLPNGQFRVLAEYLKNGATVGSREVLYTEDPTAKVIFH